MHFMTGTRAICNEHNGTGNSLHHRNFELNPGISRIGNSITRDASRIEETKKLHVFITAPREFRKQNKEAGQYGRVIAKLYE